MKYLMLLSLIITCLSSPGCIGIKKNRQGVEPVPVDWYIVNFIHFDKNSKEAVIDYMDSTMETQGKKLSRYSLVEADTPMLQTTAKIVEESNQNKNNMIALAWNDHPSGTSAKSNYAHSKGFLAFDNEKGFLINHSLPKFPMENGELFSEEFDKNFGKYMQHFYCENYNKVHFSTIIEALYTIKPYIYIHHVGNQFSLRNDNYLKKFEDANFDPKPNINATQIFEISKASEGISLVNKNTTLNKILKTKKGSRSMKKQKKNTPEKTIRSKRKRKNKEEASVKKQKKSVPKQTIGNKIKRKNNQKPNKIAIGTRTRSMYKSVLKRKIIRFFVKPHVKTTFLPWNSEILKKYQKSFYSLTWHAKTMKVDTSTSNKLVIVTDINMVNSNSMDIDSGVDVPEEKRHTKNHAKWSVSVDGEVVCLGDLNHDSTQLNRGGMIICFENKTVGQYFLGLVNNP